ncbi:hypothetical protein ACB098_01G091000 [Castanea mollissima]
MCSNGFEYCPFQEQSFRSSVFFRDTRMRKQIQTSVMILPMNLYKLKKTMPQADRADTCYLTFKEQLSRQKQKATYESPSMFSIIFSCQKKAILISGVYALIKVFTVSTCPFFLKASLRLQMEMKLLNMRVMH